MHALASSCAIRTRACMHARQKHVHIYTFIYIVVHICQLSYTCTFCVRPCARVPSMCVCIVVAHARAALAGGLHMRA